MRALLTLVLLCLIALGPTVARAQTDPAVPPSAPPAESTILGLKPTHAYAVGVGILAGAVVMDVLIGNGAAVAAGAVAGALLGSWWYGAHMLSSGTRSTRTLVPAAADLL